MQIEGWDEKKMCKAYLQITYDGSLILSWKGTFGRDKGYQVIKIDEISSISFKKGLVLGTIKINYPGGKIKFGNVNKVNGSMFVEQLKMRM